MVNCISTCVPLIACFCILKMITVYELLVPTLYCNVRYAIRIVITQFYFKNCFRNENNGRAQRSLVISKNRETDLQNK